jgi:hypothetical protein
VRPTRVVASIDLLLLLMAVIWGTNYSIVKHAFREIDAQAFNAMRMMIASSIFSSSSSVSGAPAGRRTSRGRPARSTPPRR